MVGKKTNKDSQKKKQKGKAFLQNKKQIHQLFIAKKRYRKNNIDIYGTRMNDRMKRLRQIENNQIKWFLIA